MTVKQLIDLLQKANPEAIVRAWDGDSGDKEEVTGILYDDAEVEIQTDDIT